MGTKTRLYTVRDRGGNIRYVKCTLARAEERVAALDKFQPAYKPHRFELEGDESEWRLRGSAIGSSTGRDLEARSVKQTRLTIAQERTLLRLCNAAEKGASVRFPYTNTSRESFTACALVRKGLAKRLASGAFEATTEGFWMGDALRIRARARRAGGAN